MTTRTKQQAAKSFPEEKREECVRAKIIVAQIGAAKKEELQGKQSVIQSKIKQGQLLKELKELTGHGQWEKSLKQLGINGSTAARLIQLADSWLPAEILTAGQDFIQHLPLDVQKLVKLVELTPVQARETLALGDPDEQSREQFRATVDAMKACGETLAPRAAARGAKGKGIQPDQKPIAEPIEQPDTGGIETVASEHSSQVQVPVKPPRSSLEGLSLTRTNPPPEPNKPVVNEAAEDRMVVDEALLARLQACCQAFLDLPETDWAALAGSADKSLLGRLPQLVNTTVQKLTEVQSQLMTCKKV